MYVKLNTSSGPISASGVTVDTYKTEPIGELYVPPSQYTAWCPNALWFDENKGKYLCFMYGTDTHVGSATGYMNFATIDPETLIATKPTPMIMVDENGVPVTTGTFPNTSTKQPDQIVSTNFCVLDDGTYLMIGSISNQLYRITSTDGIHWVNKGYPVDNNGKSYGVAGGTLPGGWWAIYKGNNGRIFSGFGQNGIGKLAYSDDKGITWTVVQLDYSGITGASPREPTFIKLSGNTIMALYRKSGAGVTSGTTGGAVDPAMIGFSFDNGTTWTPLKDSTTVTDMNACNVAGVVHDGIVELFVASRLYNTIESINTGETAWITHYTATIDNALEDNFTKKGQIAYANATNSVDLSSPCAALDNKGRLLLMYFDVSNTYLGTVNHHFIRGGLGFLGYSPLDGKKSRFGYSGKYIEKLLSDLKTDLASLQYKTSQINGATNPVPVPVGTLIWTKTYNANVEQIKLDVDTDFTMKRFVNTAPGYNDLLVDADGITYNKQNNNFAIAYMTTKKNLAIYYKARIGNYANLPIAAVIVNGVGYGIYKNAYGLDPVKVHEFQFEYRNGTMAAYINGIEVKVGTFTYDATNVSNYSELSTAIGTLDTTKNYIITGGAGSNNFVYELKMGDWD